MPSSIAILSGKGGVGKTTLAAALAQISGRTLIDCDPQLTATDWGDRRTALPQVISSHLGRVPQWLTQHPRAVVDTPGALVGGVTTALRAVDLVLVITGDGQPEIDALPATLDAARTAGVPFVTILNRVHPRAATDDLAALVRDLGSEVCPVVIRERSIHRRAWEFGQTALEMDSDSIAAQEIHALWRWLDA